MKKNRATNYSSKQVALHHGGVSSKPVVSNRSNSLLRSLKKSFQPAPIIAIVFLLFLGPYAFARTQQGQLKANSNNSGNKTFLEYSNENPGGPINVYRVSIAPDGTKSKTVIQTIPASPSSDTRIKPTTPSSSSTTQAYNSVTATTIEANTSNQSGSNFSSWSPTTPRTAATDSTNNPSNLLQQTLGGKLTRSSTKTSNQTESSDRPKNTGEPDKLFKINTKLDCQWSPTDDSPVKIDPKARPFDDQHLKYFGFYASAMQGAGKGDYLLETNRYMHANLAFIASDNINFVLEKLEEAKSLGMKAVVVTQPFLLDQDLHVKSDLTMWSDFSQKISPYIFSNDPTIVAFYILDEPYSNGERWGIPYVKQNLEAAGAISKQYFPTVPLAVIFAAAEIYKGGFALPQNFDWFSFDNYGCWDSAECRGGIRGTFEFLADKVSELSSLQSQKKLFAVAESYSSHEIASDGEQENIRRRAKRYFQMAQTNDCFVAYMPFIYQTFKDGGGTITGAETMPLVHKEYERQGQEWFYKQKKASR